MSHDELLARRRATRSAAGRRPRRMRGDRPAPATSSRRRTRRARLAIVPREGAAQSELRIGHLSARRDTPDYPALLVMNAVLGGQFVSRINLKLREEKGYTYGARTGFDWRRGLAPFSLQASVHTAVDRRRDPRLAGGARGHPRPAAADRQRAALAKASLTRGLSAELRDRAAGRALGGAAGALSACRTRTSQEFVPEGERRHRRRRHASGRAVSRSGAADDAGRRRPLGHCRLARGARARRRRRCCRRSCEECPLSDTRACYALDCRLPDR